MTAGFTYVIVENGAPVTHHGMQVIPPVFSQPDMLLIKTAATEEITDATADKQTAEAEVTKKNTALNTARSTMNTAGAGVTIDPTTDIATAPAGASSALDAAVGAYNLALMEYKAAVAVVEQQQARIDYANNIKLFADA